VLKFLKIPVAFFVGTFFLAAVLEINDFGIQNTFLDTYDFYLQADNSPIQNLISIERQDNVQFHIDIVPQPILPRFGKFICFFYNDSIRSYPFARHKRFITQSSLLI